MLAVGDCVAFWVLGEFKVGPAGRSSHVPLLLPQIGVLAFHPATRLKQIKRSKNQKTPDDDELHFSKSKEQQREMTVVLIHGEHCTWRESSDQRQWKVCKE